MFVDFRLNHFVPVVSTWDVSCIFILFTNVNLIESWTSYCRYTYVHYKK